MYQCWSAHPDDFQQPIAAIFGQWKLEGLSEFSIHGRPLRTYRQSDRWTQQIIEDFKALCDIEGGRSFFESLDFRFAILFTGQQQHAELVNEFVQISDRQLRHADDMQEVQPDIHLCLVIAAHRLIGVMHCFVLFQIDLVGKMWGSPGPYTNSCSP